MKKYLFVTKDKIEFKVGRNFCFLVDEEGRYVHVSKDEATLVVYEVTGLEGDLLTKNVSEFIRGALAIDYLKRQW